MITETVYIGRGNQFGLRLMADGVAIDASVITRMVVVMTGDAGTRTVDSDVDSGAFDTTIGGGVIRFKFGPVLFSGQPFPADEWTAQLTIYDNSNPEGLLWDEDFMIRTVQPDA